MSWVGSCRGVVISCQGISRINCNCQYLKVFLFISANAEDKHCQFKVNFIVCIIFKDGRPLNFFIVQNTWHSVRFSVSSLGLIVPCVKYQATALPSGPFETNQKLPLKSLISNGDLQVKKRSVNRTNAITVVKDTNSESHIQNKQENTNNLSLREDNKSTVWETQATVLQDTVLSDVQRILIGSNHLSQSLENYLLTLASLPNMFPSFPLM